MERFNGSSAAAPAENTTLRLSGEHAAGPVELSAEVTAKIKEMVRQQKGKSNIGIKLVTNLMEFEKGIEAFVRRTGFVPFPEEPVPSADVKDVICPMLPSLCVIEDAEDSHLEDQLEDQLEGLGIIFARNQAAISSKKFDCKKKIKHFDIATAISVFHRSWKVHYQEYFRDNPSFIEEIKRLNWHMQAMVKFESYLMEIVQDARRMKIEGNSEFLTFLHTLTASLTDRQKEYIELGPYERHLDDFSCGKISFTDFSERYQEEIAFLCKPAMKMFDSTMDKKIEDSVHLEIMGKGLSPRYDVRKTSPASYFENSSNNLEQKLKVLLSIEMAKLPKKSREKIDKKSYGFVYKKYLHDKLEKSLEELRAVAILSKRSADFLEKVLVGCAEEKKCEIRDEYHGLKDLFISGVISYKDLLSSFLTSVKKARQSLCEEGIVV